MKRIDDALRLLHEEVLLMPVPERFQLAIRRLREREDELSRRPRGASEVTQETEGRRG